MAASARVFESHAGPGGAQALAMRQHGPRPGPIGRLLRRLGWDRNPMRRSTDRLQAIARAVLLAAFLVGAPIVTIYVSHGIYVSGLRTQRAQAAAWHRVPAHILRVTPIAPAWRHAPGPTTLCSLRWTRPDGASQTGEITSAGNPVAGSTMTVWIDETGRLTHPPLSRAEVIDQAFHAAVVIPVALALLLAAISRVVSLMLDKHRLACWEADWTAVEPQWTGRR